MEATDITEVITSQRSMLIPSLFLIIGLVVTRYLALKYWYNKVAKTSADKRKAGVASRSIMIVLLVFGFAFIWAPELQTFALSITAFAVALVVATKELILTMLGGTYRLISQAYKVGDWVTVGALRGEVVDTGLMSTTLEELGPGKHGSSYMGQRIVVPNSKLLSDLVINESEVGPYVLHTISVPFKTGQNLKEAEKILQDSAAAVFKAEDVQFKKFTRQMSQLLDFSVGNHSPTVLLQCVDTEKNWLQISLYLPISKLQEREYEIIRTYMMWLHEKTENGASA